jgi:hypothetical protein
MAQFYWIDDAWGNTQYQRQTAESWNQVFPLIQAAIKRGTRFLITSRDYIWKAAQSDLKLQALPILRRSQVIINVQELSTQEKAQILYNHLKFGNQPQPFREAAKPHLPEIAERRDFLPESARRLGSTFFAGDFSPSRENLTAFFERPEDFLLETITNLSADCRAAIAVIFMSGGRVRSPVAASDLEPAATAFGVTGAAVREQLDSLNGSLLLLAQDEIGPYWTYKHPTVSDAFARYVAGSAEMVEIYLRGARPDSIVREVVCAGSSIPGAPVTVPDSLHSLLADRIISLARYRLNSFLSYRSNRNFAEMMLSRRPDILAGLTDFYVPIKDDVDANLIATLHMQNLLPEDVRKNFVKQVAQAATQQADASFLDDASLGAVLTDEEKDRILWEVEGEVLARVAEHVRRLRSGWEKDSSPEDVFDDFRRSIRLFVNALAPKSDYQAAIRSASLEISYAVSRMNEDYEPSSPTSAPTAASPPMPTPLVNLFRDIDE